MQWNTRDRASKGKNIGGGPTSVTRTKSSNKGPDQGKRPLAPGMIQPYAVQRRLLSPSSLY